MAYARVVIPGDGVTTLVTVDFALGYIDPEEVRCRVGNEQDGTGQPVYRTFTFQSPTLVQVDGPPCPVGQDYVFTRTVPKDSLIVDWENDDPVTKENLNKMQLQGLYYSHELDDRLTGLEPVADGLAQETAERIAADNALRSLIGQAGEINVPIFDTKLAASLANIGNTVSAIQVTGKDSINDGLGGTYTVIDNGSTDTIVSGDGRTWYRSADVSDDRIAAPSRIYNRVNQITYADDVGVSPSATEAQNAQRIYNAMGEIKDKFGSGILRLGHGHYNFGPSPDTTVYDNFGYKINASEGAIIVPTGISIVGTARNTTIVSASDPGLSVMFPISPDGQVFSDFTLDNRWDLVTASNGHGIMNLTPSDNNRTNLLAPGTFDSGTEGWAVTGDASLSNAGGRLRVTHNPSVITSGKVSKPFTTVVGREYRVRVDGYEGTAPIDTLEMSVGPDPSYAARTKIARFRLLYKTPRMFTFTATSTTTYLSVYSTAAAGSLGSTYWEIDNVYVCDFPLEDQALWCRDTTFERLTLRNVSSYAIGIENGDIINTSLRDIRVYNTGADAIDTKQRGPNQRNDNLRFSSILVENFGLRLTGSAGIDCHGRAFVDGVIARNFGAPGMVMEGIRLRTMSPPNPSDLYVGFEGEQARASTVANFICEGNGTGDCAGVAVGSPDCVVTNGMVRNVKNGVSLQGNTSGTAERYKVSNVTAVDCSEYGVVNGVGVNNGVFENITTISCGVAGIRNVATNTRLINCNDYGSTVGKSTASSAASTEILITCSFGLEVGINSSSPILGRVDTTPVGPSTNIEHRLFGKGTGPVGFGSPIRLPSYTVATLPSAATYNGCTVRVTDGVGGKQVVTSNGANWVYADGTAV